MTYVLGVDEAGRGPLAGPVSIGVVRCREDFDILAAFPGLNDSKQLAEAAREELYARLCELQAVGDVRFCVKFSSAQLIDSRGLTRAVRSAVFRGVRELMPDHEEGKVYLDGLLKAPRRYSQETVVHGDGLVPAIMLASIAAKVTRDRYMTRLAKRYPAYGFDSHKGYGTPAHYEMLQAHGPCAIHRQLFLRKFGDGMAPQQAAGPGTLVPERTSAHQQAGGTVL